LKRNFLLGKLFQSKILLPLDNFITAEKSPKKFRLENSFEPTFV
jgi:hypothetical protein